MTSVVTATFVMWDHRGTWQGVQRPPSVSRCFPAEGLTPPPTWMAVPQHHAAAQAPTPGTQGAQQWLPPTPFRSHPPGWWGLQRLHTSTQRPSPPVHLSLAFCTSTSTCRGRRQGQKVSASTHTTKAAARLKCSVRSHLFGTRQLCPRVSIFLMDKTCEYTPKHKCIQPLQIAWGFRISAASPAWLSEAPQQAGSTPQSTPSTPRWVPVIWGIGDTDPGALGNGGQEGEESRQNELLWGFLEPRPR